MQPFMGLLAGRGKTELHGGVFVSLVIFPFPVARN